MSSQTIVNDVKESKKGKIKITMNSIEENVGKHDDQIRMFLKSQHMQMLVLSFNRFYLCRSQGTRNKTYDLVLNELTRRWYELSIEDLDENSFWLVSTFINKDDYTETNTHPKLKNDLEDFLARMLWHQFTFNNSVASNQSYFRILFDKLRLQHVTLNTLKKIVNLGICSQLRYQDQQFSEKILRSIMFLTFNEPKTELTRFDKPKTVNEKDSKSVIPTCTCTTPKGSDSDQEPGCVIQQRQPTLYLVEPIKLSDIKVDDVFDIKDQHGDWYVSRVVEKSCDKIVMKYDGFSDSYNESFNECTCIGRFAKLGTMTNGISHSSDDSGEGCKCSTCISQCYDSRN